MSTPIPTFRIKHVGINNPNDAAAEIMLETLSKTFDLPRANETDSHIFAGSLFEVMKNTRYGEYGHVALQTEDVEAAIAYFAEKGIGIQEDTIRRDDQGHIIFAYLQLEIGGFAFHLTK